MIKSSSLKRILDTWETAALPLGGLGAGFIARSLLEKKNIRKTDDVEDTNANNAIKRLPLLGFGAGFVVSPFWRGLLKKAELRESVELRPHQEDAIRFIEDNRHAIIAHATGLGKTLTSIAAFERLKDKGKASRAIIVVPASLRDNYAKNINEFTNSEYSIYGPKGEKGSIYYDKPSSTPYNIISYELYKKDPEGIRERIGADTLIVDEAHRTRNEASETYNKLQGDAANYKNIITLTGSLVNNEPSDITSLIDVTFGKTENAIANRKMFDKLFVRRDVSVKGFINPKTVTTPSIINKKHLSDLLKDKVHYMSHKDMEKDMPPIKEELIRVPMTKRQKNLYMYSLNNLDPITRMKIKNNIPVSQREIAGLFGELMQGRKVMTDPSAMDTKLDGMDPYDYSPKVKRVVDDLQDHLKDSPKNKAVIYGNLIHHQIDAVKKTLDNRGIPYTTYFGIGNEGNSSKQRSENIKEYMNGKKRVLLISGAGGEGLDLKGSTMMQMLEGHYNPEKIQQAESRVRRMGDKPDKPIIIKQYVSTLPPSTLQKGLSFFGVKPYTSIDEYIYNVADRKDKLNSEFREVLTKKSEDVSTTSTMFGNRIGSAISDIIDKRETVGIDAAIKQRLINESYPEYTSNKHYNGIKKLTGIDERVSMSNLGSWLIGIGATPYISKTLTSIPMFRNAKGLGRVIYPAIASAIIGAGVTVGTQQLPKRLIRGRIMRSDDIPKAIDEYNIKLDKKVLRKLKSSALYLDEADRLQRMGISQRMLEI